MVARSPPLEVVMAYINALDSQNYDAAMNHLHDQVRIRGPAGGDGLVKGTVDALQHPTIRKLGEEVVDRVVEIHLSLVDKDHGSCGGDGFGHR